MRNTIFKKRSVEMLNAALDLCKNNFPFYNPPCTSTYDISCPFCIKTKISYASGSVMMCCSARQMGISLSDKKTLFRFAINKTGIKCYSKYIIPIFNNIIPFTFDNGNSFIVPNDIIVMIFFNHWYI